MYLLPCGNILASAAKTGAQLQLVCFSKEAAVPAQKLVEEQLKDVQILEQKHLLPC